MEGKRKFFCLHLVVVACNMSIVYHLFIVMRREFECICEQQCSEQPVRSPKEAAVFFFVCFFFVFLVFFFFFFFLLRS